MKKINLGQRISILANIGVIAGIAFLAIEISQNTAMMESQTRNALTEKQMDFYMEIGTNEYAAELLFDTLGESKSILGDDTSKIAAFDFIIMANFRMWENEWYQHQKGLYEEDEFLARSSLWFDILANPNLRVEWDQRKNSYAPDFREYLDKVLMAQQTLN